MADQWPSQLFGACTESSSDFPIQPAVFGELANGTSFFASTATGGGAIGYANSSWAFDFTRPDFATILDDATVTQVTVRCDHALPGVSAAGCVNPDYYPTMVYSRSGPYPDLARHIGAAQASGLPGAYGSDTYLTRLVNQLLQNRNRATACPNPRYPRPAGYQCDEYPFSSSWQGASTGGGSPRTTDGCSIRSLPTTTTGPSGYSVCMIPGFENMAGGNALGSFYNVNRVLDSDRFSVWITP